MGDELFPSGPWTGFYNYRGPEDRHRMDLHLEFAQGRLSGDGTDNIGLFLIRGRYDANAREVWWTKSYVGLHSVQYHGFREGVGIWGTWEIPPVSRGGFQIWPRAAGEGTHETRAETKELPVEAVGTPLKTETHSRS